MKRLRLIALAVILVGIAATAALLWQRLAPGETLAVKKILIDVDPAAVAAGIDREAVRGVAADVVADTRGIDVDEAAAGAVLRIRVESFSAVTPPAPADHPPMPPSTSLALAIDVIDDGRTVGRGRAVAAAQGVMGADTLVGQAIRDALRQIQQARAADRLDSDTLLTWLTDPDVGESQRRRAMQALASRGDRRATPVLVGMLQAGTDEGEAAGILQALALLADADAIDAVIAYSERQPPAVRKLCIDVVKASASPRGVPWLFTLSSGHPDADVQAHARAALARLAPDVAEAAAPVGG
jgi:outer membrane lipoprotein SlyB